MSDATDARAREIMCANDRGGYTVPTARLYPHQWNWDSAFAALGFATFDLDRAWTELETLFEAQWPGGMVPHIVFRRDDDDYFPGIAEWGVERDPPTSGISQPPVAASVALDLYRQDPGAGEARLRALFPRLLAWHRWYRSARDPDGTGLVAVVHPWESGRDNSPDWDRAMSRMRVADLPAYTRRDTGHVAAELRPTQGDYDRFMTIVAHGRACGWDDEVMRTSCPLLVIDPATTFIALRADRDLAAIARIVGDEAVAREREAAAAHAAGGVRALWSDASGAYLARDVRTGASAGTVCIGAFTAFYAGLGSPALAGTLTRMLDRVSYALPSADPASESFDPRRYWRGPVWPQMNYLVGRGLAESGHADLAARLRDDLATLIADTGFHECFSPLDGTGTGGGDFTWTAALWLHWAAPSARSGR